MKHLKIFTFVITILLITVANGSDQFAARIAIVDVESILENSVAISNFRKSTDQRLEEIQKEINIKEKEFKSYEADLISKRESLKEEKFKELADEFVKSVSNVQKNIQLRKLELEKKRSIAMQKVHEATISIISDIAKKYNINIVLPSNQVLFVTNELNITNEVITKLNDEFREVGIK